MTTNAWPNLLLTRLKDLHAKLKKHPAATIDVFEIGAELSKAEIAALLKRTNARRAEEEDVEIDLPEELAALVSVLDGVNLRFSVRTGTETIKCKIWVAPLARILDNVGYGPIEDEYSWKLFAVTIGDVVLGDSEVFVLNEDGDATCSETLPLSRVVTAMVDSLGVPGWELMLWDEPGDAARATAATVRTLGETLGIDVPRAERKRRTR